MRPTREQLMAGYAALKEAGADPEAVSEAMAADGLSVATTANRTQAAARAQLERLKPGQHWFQKLLSGDSEATALYEKLNQDLAAD